MKSIFFINNNTTLFCALLAAEHLNIDWNKSIFALSRQTDDTLIPSHEKYDLNKPEDTATLKNIIRAQSSGFSVFLPHDGSSRGIRKKTISHSFCEQVYYLEEGLLSHKTKPYRLSNDAKKLCEIPIIGKKLQPLLEKPLFSARNAHFFSLSDTAFPTADRNSVTKLENYAAILQHYRPRLNSSAYIMLATPAEPFEKILETCKRIANKDSDTPVYLKLHPDAHQRRYQEKTQSIIVAAENAGVAILDPGTIIELEVMLTGHHLIGNETTSLAFYSRLFGGEYTPVRI